MSGTRMEGMARNLGGQFKEGAGNMFGDAKTAAEGKADQIAGRVQEKYGEISEQARNVSGQVTDFTRAQPWTALLLAFGVGYVIRMLTR